MMMQLNDLWLLTDAGDEWEIDRPAAVADLVAALIAEGGEIRNAFVVDRWHRLMVAPVSVLGEEPGRYLVYGPIPPVSPEVPT